MDENKEIKKIKNTIAIKTVGRTLLFTFIAILVFTFIIDGLYNDELANDVSGFNRSLYIFLVKNPYTVPVP